MLTSDLPLMTMMISSNDKIPAPATITIQNTNKVHHEQRKKTQPLRVLIFGAGAIGLQTGLLLTAVNIEDTPEIQVTLLGRKRIKTLFAEQTVEVSLLNRYGEEKKFTLPSPIPSTLSDTHMQTNTKPTTIVATEDDVNGIETKKNVAASDIVIVATKTLDTDAVIETLKMAALPKQTIILSLQNGIRGAERLKEEMKQHKVLRGVVEYNVSWTGRSVKQMTTGRILVEADESLAPLVKTWNKVGMNAMMRRDMREVQYSKLLVNFANAINALAGVPLQETLRERQYRHALAASVDEGLSVLRAEGIKPDRMLGKMPFSVYLFMLRLPDWAFSCLRNFMVKTRKGSELSMAQDLNSKRLTEVDYINGQIVLIAKRHGLCAPINEKIVALIHEAERTGRPRYLPDQLARLLELPRLKSPLDGTRLIQLAVMIIGIALALRMGKISAW